MLLFLKSCQAKPQPAIFFQAGGQVSEATGFHLPFKATSLGQSCRQWGESLTVQICLGHARTVLPTPPPEAFPWFPCAPRIKVKCGASCHTLPAWPLPTWPACSLHTHPHVHTPALWFCYWPGALCCPSPCVMNGLFYIRVACLGNEMVKALFSHPRLLSRGKQLPLHQLPERLASGTMAVCGFGDTELLQVRSRRNKCGRPPSL